MINLEKWFNCWVKVIVFSNFFYAPFFFGCKNNVFVRYFVCHIFIWYLILWDFIQLLCGYREARRLEFQFKVDFYDLYFGVWCMRIFLEFILLYPEVFII